MPALCENKYFPVGTTWKEEQGLWWLKDTVTYEVKDEVLLDRIPFNEIFANGERYCLIREEGPLVFIWINEYYHGLLYDFDWYEGKDYFACSWWDEPFHEKIFSIEEKMLNDSNTYKIWKPNIMDGNYIICGVGGTNSILSYYYPTIIGGGSRLLEFTRGVTLYNNDSNPSCIKVVQTGKSVPPKNIRLMRNDNGSFDILFHDSDGLWKIVK